MTKKIASIYFEDQIAERTLYGGRFHLPAVAKDGAPVIIEIKDHYQWETMPWFTGIFNGRQRQERKTILGEDIAADLIREWTESHPGMGIDCKPGIWIVRDVIHLFDENGVPQQNADGTHAYRMATEEEAKAMFAEDLAAAKQRQWNWIEACITKGDIMAENVKQVPFIPGVCKDAVRYAGRERKWLFALKDSDVKTCKWCTKTIASTAVVCPECGNVVDPQQYAALKAQEKQMLDAATKGVVQPQVKGQPQHVA